MPDQKKGQSSNIRTTDEKLVPLVNLPRDLIGRIAEYLSFRDVIRFLRETNKSLRLLNIRIKQFEQLGLCELMAGDLPTFINRLDKIYTPISLLDLNFCGRIASLDPLADLRGLQVLDLSTCLSITSLDPLAGLRELQVLKLHDTRITDAGLAHLAPLTALRELDLSDTEITDAGLAHLAPLTALRELDLSGTGITDAGLERLLAGLPAVQKLNLLNTSITDEGMAHLAGLPALQELDLCFCEKNH